jgi:cyclophilin family peptidyl-prolyl cis-trans isomerase
MPPAGGPTGEGKNGADSSPGTPFFVRPFALAILSESIASSAIVPNWRAFIESLDLSGRASKSLDHLWFLARPTQQSLAMAASTRQRQPPAGHVSVKTTAGDFVVELDCSQATLGCINFIGHILRGNYTNAAVDRVDRTRHFRIRSVAEVDETVWGTPIAYDRDDARRDFRFPVYLANTGNVQIHITNTAQIVVGCQPVDVGQHHVIGGVVAGEAVVTAICTMTVFPGGRRTQPVAVREMAIADSPFAMTPG